PSIGTTTPSTLLPCTTLFRSRIGTPLPAVGTPEILSDWSSEGRFQSSCRVRRVREDAPDGRGGGATTPSPAWSKGALQRAESRDDRKSTRLNSRHVKNSYAVF